jgi:hypothetical protein
MAVDSTTPRTRRAILASGLAAAAAATLGRAQPVSAHDADDVQLGAANYATSPTQVINTTPGLAAVVGTSAGIGVNGDSNSDTGVYGTSVSGLGVYGTSHTYFGVAGYSVSSTGLQGYSDAADKPAALSLSAGNSTGLQGYSGPAGSLPPAPAKTGVYGYAAQDATAVGVRGTSTVGRGGLFKGGAAQLRLSPSAATTHPASGLRGDLFADKHGRLWFCKGATTWKQLA